MLAANYVLDHKVQAMVHGTIQGFGNAPIGHAWVLLPDGEVWEPTTNAQYDAVSFAAMFNPVTERTYTSTETARAMLLHNHFGPWHGPHHKEIE